MRQRRRVRRAGVTVLVALALAGCGLQAGSKAGGPGTPVVLRMATRHGVPGYMPQVDPYLLNRVAKLSAGNVKIDMVYHVGENAKALHPHLVQRRHHPRGDAAVDDSLLQWIAVDQQRGGERLEAVDAQGVEDPGADDTEIVPAGGDAADDLLFAVRRVLADVIHHVDLDVSCG